MPRRKEGDALERGERAIGAGAQLAHGVFEAARLGDHEDLETAQAVVCAYRLDERRHAPFGGLPFEQGRGEVQPSEGGVLDERVDERGDLGSAQDVLTCSSRKQQQQHRSDHHSDHSVEKYTARP